MYVLMILGGLLSAYLAWRFRNSQIDLMLFGATAVALLSAATSWVLPQPSAVSAILHLVGGSTLFNYPLGLMLGVRGLFFSGDRLAKGAAIAGFVILFLPLLMVMVMGVLAGSAPR